MFEIGIDDAGRGPLIGPMVLAGVLVDKEQEKIIKSAGATDSKLLSHQKRIQISEIIKKTAENYFIVKTTPEEIDNSINSGTNLNTLEAIKAAMIINKLNPKKEKVTVIVDCPSVNTDAWKNTLLKYIEKKDNLVLKIEHKADLNHISAAAGSILAKVVREEEVDKIKKEYGNIGSGYPSDPMTKQFLKNRGKELSESGIFRKSWATWKKMYPRDSLENLSKGQRKLFG